MAAAARTRTARTPIQTARTHSALTRCVGPVEAERFFDEYWERKPLLVPRDEEGRFDDLLSVEEIEARVTGGGLRHPAFRVVKEGAKYTLDDYTEDISWSPTPFSGTAKVERVATEQKPHAGMAGLFSLVELLAFAYLIPTPYLKSVR